MPLQFLDNIDSTSAEGLSLPADLTVAEVVKTDILCCSPDTPLSDAATAMQERRCSSILIVEEGRPVGIWTERDALSIDFDSPDQLSRPIGSVMSTPVSTIREDTPLRSVASLFRQNSLRHFLVVDGADQPLGIVTQTDVVIHQGIEHYLHLRAVSAVVRRDIPRLQADALLAEAVAGMKQHVTAAILVEFPGEAFGILTERDLVGLIADQAQVQTIGELASRPLLTVPEDTSLYRARNMLTESRIRHIGITSGQELIGLVSFSEIMSDIESVYVRELQQALEVRDRALSASRRNLQLAERIIESTLEGVIITDARGRILSVNPAFTRITGYSEEEVLGRAPSVLSSGRHDAGFYTRLWRSLNENGHWEGEIWNRKKNGELLPEYLSITAITDDDGRVSHYAGMFNDISQLKASEESIRNMAYRDPLTGLPNRRLMDDRLDMAIAHAHRHGRLVGVIFIDLDYFKQVNDSLGHGAGDEMLVSFAQRLESCVRENDTVARLGGDEFVIILADPESADSVRQTAKRILETIRSPLTIQGQELQLTASVGVSVYPEHGLSGQTLLKHADAAMYQIKDHGRDGFSIYTASTPLTPGNHLNLRQELRRALDQGQLELHYQPLVNADEQWVGAEALIRWQHPELGMVLPYEFIPLAEDSGLIIPLGDFVVREAAEQLARWREQGLMLAEMAINISGRQLRDRDFANRFDKILQETGVAPAQLVLELTESVLMDAAAGPHIQSLKDLGASLALDDFGTGYGALVYLKQFPLDRIKIDRSFVRDMVENSPDAAIVSMLIKLAQKLELAVVAEGVENRLQLEALRGHGCDFFQGFMFAPALPAAEFAARYRQQEGSMPVAGAVSCEP